MCFHFGNLDYRLVILFAYTPNYQRSILMPNIIVVIVLKKIKYGTCTFRNLISRNFNWVFGFNLYHSVVGGMLISVPQTSIDREGNFSLSELHKEHRVTTSLPLLLQLTSPTEDRSLLCLVISKSLIAIVCPV